MTCATTCSAPCSARPPPGRIDGHNVIRSRSAPSGRGRVGVVDTYRLGVARQRRVGPVQDDGAGREDDGLEADGRHQRRHRLRRCRFVARPHRLVDRTAVAHLPPEKKTKLVHLHTKKRSPKNISVSLDIPKTNLKVQNTNRNWNLDWGLDPPWP